jgi:hypothetical protein
MRAIKLLLSFALIAIGTGFAVMQAAARYSDVALHSLSIALLMTASACVVSASSLRFILPHAAIYQKVLFYLVVVSLWGIAIVVYCVGLDGNLPRHDGQQSVGLNALLANADLFAMVIVAATIACCTLFLRRPKLLRNDTQLER